MKNIDADVENVQYQLSFGMVNNIILTRQQLSTNCFIQLLKDLFASSWEKRHGSAVAIRELVKLQGKDRFVQT